ncbi:hypothetical protein RN001_009968 [Aquatica leii]|uniref:Uncharacterized protein n=1 Tax=Aquatica leii TaxID=1421715 RepID=A0AAN7PVW8_9COLE|nr:hypothetical protein RN001_009968 [Aquatica leii]
MEKALPIVFCIILTCGFLTALPMLSEVDDDYEVIKVNNTNGTAHDLYVIRTIVYEVGILTDANNDTDVDESFEEIDFKFYDPKHNHSAFNLSSILMPIETNVTGEIITSITNGSFGPIIPNYFVKQLVNLSTSDPQEEKEIIKHLPVNLGIN